MIYLSNRGDRVVARFDIWWVPTRSALVRTQRWCSIEDVPPGSSMPRSWAAVRQAVGKQLLLDDLRAGLTTLDLTALEAVGVSLEVEIPADVFPPGRRRKQHLPFTAGAKQVLATTLEEAVTLGHRHIGLEHILLGIARRPLTDPAIRLLQHVGLSPETLHANLATFLRRSA